MDAAFLSVLALTCFAVVLVAFKVVFDSLLEAHQRILDLQGRLRRLERLSRERSHRVRARVRVVEHESRSTRATLRQLFGSSQVLRHLVSRGAAAEAKKDAASEEWRLG